MDNRIMQLTNELLNELDKQGYDYMHDNIITGFGCLHIWKYPDGSLRVEGSSNFEVKGRRSA